MTNLEAAQEILRALPFTTRAGYINKHYRTYCKYMGVEPVFGWADNGYDRRMGQQRQTQTIWVLGHYFKGPMVQRALNKILKK